MFRSIVGRVSGSSTSDSESYNSSARSEDDRTRSRDMNSARSDGSMASGSNVTLGASTRANPLHTTSRLESLEDMPSPYGNLMSLDPAHDDDDDDESEDDSHSVFSGLQSLPMAFAVNPDTDMDNADPYSSDGESSDILEAVASSFHTEDSIMETPSRSVSLSFLEDQISETDTTRAQQKGFPSTDKRVYRVVQKKRMIRRACVALNVVSLLLLIFSGAFIVTRGFDRKEPDDAQAADDITSRTSEVTYELPPAEQASIASIPPDVTQRIAPITPPKELKHWCDPATFPETKPACLRACSHGACCIGQKLHDLYSVLEVDEKCDSRSPMCMHYAPCWHALKISDILTEEGSAAHPHKLPSISNVNKHCNEDQSSTKCQKLCVEALCCHPDNRELCRGVDLTTCPDYSICWGQEHDVKAPIEVTSRSAVIPGEGITNMPFSYEQSDPPAHDETELEVTAVPDNDDVSVLSFFCNQELLTQPGGFDNCRSACIPFECCFEEKGCSQMPFEIDCHHVELCSMVFNASPPVDLQDSRQNGGTYTQVGDTRQTSRNHASSSYYP